MDETVGRWQFEVLIWQDWITIGRQKKDTAEEKVEAYKKRAFQAEALKMSTYLRTHAHH
jgi:hypothetical protein